MQFFSNALAQCNPVTLFCHHYTTATVMQNLEFRTHCQTQRQQAPGKPLATADRHQTNLLADRCITEGAAGHLIIHFTNKREQFSL